MSALSVGKVFAGLKWLSQFMLMIVATLGTPFVMLLALPFLKRDTTNVLPKVLQFLNTYDDLGSGQGMYETQVKWVYDHFGWYVKTWYWLGLRNQCYTLFNWLAPDYVDSNPTYIKGNWKITTGTDSKDNFYFMVLHKTKDIGIGWKLFNREKPTLYFRPRFWKPQNN